MAESSIQRDLRVSRERRKKLLAKRDASLEEKKAKEAVTKQKKKDLNKSMGSPASRNAARAMASDEGNTGGQGQTAIPISAESRKRLGTLSINALTAIPIGQVVGGVARIGKGLWKVGEQIYNSARAARAARAAQVAQTAKAVKPPTATPRVVNSKVKPISKNAGLAGNATRKTPVVKAKPTPPRKVAPSKLSKVGQAREASRNPVSKNQGLASIRATPVVKAKTTPPPKVAPSKRSKAGKAKDAKAKASAGKDKPYINPLLPLAIAAGITGVGLNSLPSKAPKTPKPSKSQYDSTMVESAGKKTKPSSDLRDAFNANTEDGFNPLSPESKAKNNPKNPPKLKNAPKKKDPDYKLYSGDLAKKYDLKYMTDEAMERDEEKRIADGAKSGGHLKKLKHGGKVTKKSKGGFMNKGAGCARRGF